MPAVEVYFVLNRTEFNELHLAVIRPCAFAVPITLQWFHAMLETLVRERDVWSLRGEARGTCTDWLWHRVAWPCARRASVQVQLALEPGKMEKMEDSEDRQSSEDVKGEHGTLLNQVA